MGGAIVGEQIDTAKMILSYSYEPAIGDPPKANEDKAVYFNIFGKDEDDNNILHLCTLSNMREIRRMIDKSEWMVVFKKSVGMRRYETLKRARNKERKSKFRHVAYRLNR